MDSEKATSAAVEVNLKRSRNCCSKVFIAIALVMGIIACALSIATLAIQIVNMKQEHTYTLPSHYSPQQEKQLLTEVAQYLHDSEYNETFKKSKRNMDCSSFFDSSLTVKPSAHIAGTSWGASNVNFKDSYFFRQNPILSAGWSCEESRMSHVLGGMKYNSQNGFMRVPTEGMYYVYSQIRMNVTSPNTNRPTKLGHITAKCTCEDETQLDGSCYCYSMEDSVPYNDYTDQLMRSLSWDKESAGGSSFHGGLFHLTTNSYIGIVPVIPDKGNPQLSIIAKTIDSFFGAFYVTGLTYPVVQPSPSPSPSN